MTTIVPLFSNLENINNSSLRKRVIAWDLNSAHAHLSDYLGGRECKQTWRKAKWNVSEGR